MNRSKVVAYTSLLLKRLGLMSTKTILIIAHWLKAPEIHIITLNNSFNLSKDPFTTFSVVFRENFSLRLSYL